MLEWVWRKEYNLLYYWWECKLVQPLWKRLLVLVCQLCPTLCNTMACSLPGSSVHGIFQAILLEWIAISFSRGSSQPRDQTRVSHIVDRRLPSEPPGKSFFLISLLNFLYLFRGYYSISVWFLFYFLG